jgi:site-specific recombinase XerD
MLEDGIAQLFFTDIFALRGSTMVDGTPFALSAAVITAAESAGLVDDMPFILGDDGVYQHDLNRFFRACPTMGVRSLNSLRAYARDILVWMRFLEERRGGKTVWQAERDDVIAFHHARRLAKAPYRISASSWNRALAALDKLHRWGLEEGLIKVSPFSYGISLRRAGERGIPQVVEANRARERAARSHNMRFADLGRYLAFRDVGLRGRLPDGAEDPSWRGRNGERNALFAELLVTTGMRLSEAGSLFLAELPSIDGKGPRALPFDLPGAITKGERPRRIRLPRRVLKLITNYVDLDRRIAAGRATATVADPLWLAPDGRSATDPHGNRAPLSRIGVRDRQRVLHASSGRAEHALLWLTEGGKPVPSATWEVAFRRASLRCQSFGIDVVVTPHMLRHTFAINMLSMLIREQIGTVFNPADSHGAAYRHILGDPLQKLQHLLGHASITSTYIYLDSLAEAQELVDAAADRWDTDLAGDHP